NSTSGSGSTLKLGYSGLFRSFICFVFVAIDKQRRAGTVDCVFIQHDTFDILEGRKFIHGAKQRLLDNGTQAACPGSSLDGFLRNGTQSLRTNFEFDVFHFEQFLELLDQGVLGFGKNPHQGMFVQLLQGGDHRQTTHEFGDEAKLDEIFGFDFGEKLADAPFGFGTHRGRKTNTGFFGPVADDLFETVKGPTDNKQNIGGVYLYKILVGVLASTLGRHRGHRAFDQLEQGLLYTFAGHVAGDRRIVRLTGDLVDFVDIDNGALRLFDIVVAILQQLLHDVFDVFTHVSGFGKCGGIGHDERNIKHAS